MENVEQQVKAISELRHVMPEEVFAKAYEMFMRQAEENAKSKKAHGSRLPYGLDKGSKDVDGKTLSQHFGQGTASQTPYLSWYVVSIYYLVEDSTIIIGIEKNRYSHLPQMMPIRYGKFGRKEEVAIFYEKAKDKLDYAELYEKFISISEEVLHLGTEDK